MQNVTMRNNLRTFPKTEMDGKKIGKVNGQIVQQKTKLRFDFETITHK